MLHLEVSQLLHRIIKLKKKNYNIEGMELSESSVKL